MNALFKMASIIAFTLLIFFAQIVTGQEPRRQTSARSPDDQTANDRTVFKNSLGLVFIWMPPATIELGNTDYAAEFPGSPELGELEKPRTIRSSGFYIQSTEVTNSQFKMYSAEIQNVNNSSDFLKHLHDEDLKGFRLDECPVVFVNVEDVKSYCAWLTKKCGQSYRLPTEDEWEYACNCSSTIDNGKEVDPDVAGWFAENSEGHTHRVASQSPNSIGLFDMQGNVWEWTSTEFDKQLIARTDFAGRVVLHIKGGGWANKRKTCTCTSRWAGWPPDYRSNSVGFRLVMEKDEN